MESEKNLNQKRYFAESKLAVFEGNISEQMGQLVEWMNQHIRIKHWGDKEIEEKFAKRSAAEILADGDTGYMNPCSDLSLVAYALLKKNNLNPTLVADVLIQQGRPGVRMHFALEFKSKEGELWSLEFVSKNLTTLKKGEYHNDRPDVQTLKTVRINQPIDFKDNIRTVLLRDGFREQDVDLGKIIEGFKKDNTVENFNEYEKSLGEIKELYLDQS